MSLLRQPPQPPPKPKSYTSQQLNHFPNKIGEIAPQDSDTDSGICADSDQSSPRQPQQPQFPTSYRAPHQIYRNLPDESRDYLTPNSARRLFSTTAEQSPRRTLPPRPGTTQTRKPQFRVRFADEVDSQASTSSSSEHSNSPRHIGNEIQNGTSLRQANPIFTKQLVNNAFNKYEQPIERRFDSLPRAPRRSSNVSYSIDDVETLPEPPSYAIAVQRLRTLEPAAPRESVRDSVIRQNVADTMSRSMRNRSSSLPRGTRASELRSVYGDRPLLDYQMNRMASEQLVGSLDNLRINTDMDYGSYDDSSLRRRRLPTAPLMGSVRNIPDSIDVERESVRQPAYMRQRRCRARAPTLTRRSASVGRYEDSNEYEYRAPEPAVRAQLVALDQRGFRTVLVEKTQPGPFGFYIATGVMNGQRGIFISRVSLPSLSPMLSIGDEILYVDDELVKGRSLEYVQSLIAGKTAVVIVLLPTVGPALC